MSLLATVENGVILIPADANLPDGTKVRVEALVEPTLLSTEEVGDPNEPRTLADHLAPWIGIAEGLPSDFAAEHNHYIHGTPKRKP